MFAIFNLLNHHQHIATAPAAGAVMLVAAPVELDEAWKASLTAEQQQDLQSEPDDLQRQAQHEHNNASTDLEHPDQVGLVEREYVRT